MLNKNQDNIKQPKNKPVNQSQVDGAYRTGEQYLGDAKGVDKIANDTWRNEGGRGQFDSQLDGAEVDNRQRGMSQPSIEGDSVKTDRNGISGGLNREEDFPKVKPKR